MDSSLQETSSTQQPTWRPVRADTGQPLAPPVLDDNNGPSSTLIELRAQDSSQGEPIATSQVHESWSLQAGNSIGWKDQRAHEEESGPVLEAAERDDHTVNGEQAHDVLQDSADVEDDAVVDDIDREWSAMESSEPADAMDLSRDIDLIKESADANGESPEKNPESKASQHALDPKDATVEHSSGNANLASSRRQPNDVTPSTSPRGTRSQSSNIDELSPSSPRDTEPGPYIESPGDTSPRPATEITPKKTRSTGARSSAIKVTAIKSPHQPISTFSPSKVGPTAANRISRQASAPTQAVQSPLKRERTFERAHSSKTVGRREEESFGGDASLKPRQRLELLVGRQRQRAGPQEREETSMDADEGSGTDTEEAKETSFVSQSLLDIPQEAEPAPRLAPIDEVSSSQVLEPTFRNSSPRQESHGPLSSHRYEDDDPSDPASPTPVRRILHQRGGSAEETREETVLFTQPQPPTRSSIPHDVKFTAFASSSTSSQVAGLSQPFDGSEKGFGEDDASQQEYSMAATQAVHRTASSKASSPELPPPESTYVPPPLAIPSVSTVSSMNSPTASTNPRVSASRQLGRSRPQSGTSGQLEASKIPSPVVRSAQVFNDNTVSSNNSRPGTRSSNISASRRLGRVVRSENSIPQPTAASRGPANGDRKALPARGGPISIAILPGLEATQLANIPDRSTQQHTSSHDPDGTYIDSHVRLTTNSEPDSSQSVNMPTDTLINPSSSAPAIMAESHSLDAEPGFKPSSRSNRDSESLSPFKHSSPKQGLEEDGAGSSDRHSPAGRPSVSLLDQAPPPPPQDTPDETPPPTARKSTPLPPYVTSGKSSALPPLTPSSSRSTPLRDTGSRRGKAFIFAASPHGAAGILPDQPTSPVQPTDGLPEVAAESGSPSLEAPKVITPVKHRYGQTNGSKRERKPTAKVREAREEAAKKGKGKNIKKTTGKKPSRTDEPSEEEWDSGSTQIDPRDESFRPQTKSKHGGASRRRRIVQSSPDAADIDEEMEDDDGSEDVVMAETPTNAHKPGKRSPQSKKPANGKRARAAVDAESDLGSSPLTTYESGDETYLPAHPAVRAVRGRAEARSTRASSVSTNGKISAKRRKVDVKKKSIDRTNAEIEPLQLVPDEPASPLMVLCYWTRERRYYIGQVDDQIDDKFKIRFLDGYHTIASIDRLRRLELRKDDIIRCNSKTYPQGDCVLVEDYNGDTRGVKVHTEQEEIRFIPLDLVWIPFNVVKRDWTDRLVEPRHLGLSSYDGLERNAAPKLSQVFVGKTFLITAHTPRPGEIDVRKQLGDIIVKQGGTVVKDYVHLLTHAENSFESAMSSEDVPFLLVHEHNSKPKLLAALAAGIPCLSSSYVADSIERVSHGMGKTDTSRSIGGRTSSRRVCRICSGSGRVK